MLVLARRQRESILMTLKDGTLVKMTVDRIERGKVFLRFEAPKEVAIWRAEIRPALQAPVPPVALTPGMTAKEEAKP